MCWCCETEHKNFIRGGVDESDFVPTVRHKKKAKKKPRVRGCPGNDNKAHIYVWTQGKHSDGEFFEYFGFYRREEYVCVGCERVAKSRYTEEYLKRAEAHKKKLHAQGRRDCIGLGWPFYDEGWNKFIKNRRARW